MEGAAQDAQPLLTTIDQLATAMAAGIGKGRKFVFAGPDDYVGERRDIVIQHITDVRDIVLMAGKLPHTTPEFLDFQIVELAGVVAFDTDRKRGVIRR